MIYGEVSNIVSVTFIVHSYNDSNGGDLVSALNWNCLALGYCSKKVTIKGISKIG